ncbi:hypothetical protein [Alteromonas lipolytica]|uniref:Zinc resistance-associated protein n=1 Tax=Alteromonas lipolytica TaxID=1856405 RepID=A0A1E8FII0_9ALTE|nr:hypothetical protein [Alteromonas lipolytica]OFI35750.1 hypothetical protein BFC17_10715 [Alteromonas lipolytica]GGF80467.1 hypothetical protein GCM10011338_35900 [Alteromonas lipolytica]
MNSVFKKLSVIACAAMITGAGISGVALAANASVTKTQQSEDALPLLPPMLERMAEKLELTEAQKSQLKALKEKQQALRAEFWSVFTDEQKNTILEMMMKHRKQRGGDRLFHKGGHKERKGGRGDKSPLSEDAGTR